MTHAERRERLEKAIKLLEEGKSLLEASEETGVSVAHLSTSARLRGLGYTRRPKGFSSYEIIGRLVTTNDPFATIADEFRCSRQNIEQIYKRSQEVGIPVRKR